MSSIDVFLQHTPGYNWPHLSRIVGELIARCGLAPGPGDAVLVKPNLVAPFNPALSCTHPAVLAAACAYLLDCGARVTVADSPAFGTAGIVAAAGGHAKALAPLGLAVQTLANPRRLPLRLGGHVGVSAQALDAATILNVARFKVHDQMLITGAVKNMFGAVVGFRKAVAHHTHGECGTRFESMIFDVYEAVRPVVSLMDAVVAMHEKGPAKGRPYPLAALAASADGVALDTALYAALGLASAQVPLGREALARNLPGADPANLAFPLAAPHDFNTEGFVLPPKLAPVSFNPVRLAKGRLKSAYIRLRGALAHKS